MKYLFSFTALALWCFLSSCGPSFHLLIKNKTNKEKRITAYYPIEFRDWDTTITHPKPYSLTAVPSKPLPIDIDPVKRIYSFKAIPGEKVRIELGIANMFGHYIIVDNDTIRVDGKRKQNNKVKYSLSRYTYKIKD